MRILAIRGRNLASLAEPFEIDLAGGALASAGLFAITGDTGAGKSTILDAMCLALYGTFPRAGTRSAETRVRDPGGEDLLPADPRNALRRGAGSGFAEVDFVGRDGATYRARWEVRRARNIASGRLQPPSHALWRLPEREGVVSGRQDVREAVAERTGFSFDQFRRTVLLAQGEFDAFLMAPESERAELLERITGTSIYGAISMRVHQETAARRAALERAAAQGEAISILDEAARSEVAGAQRQLAEAVQAATRAREASAAELRAAEAIVSAREAASKAEARARAAGEAAAAAGDDRRRLGALRALAPLKPLQQAVTAAGAAAEAAREGERRVATDLARCEKEAEAAGKRLLDATEAAAAAARDVELHTPAWEAAATLDRQLDEAGEEIDATARTFDELAAEAEKAAEQHQAATAALAALDRELKAATGELSLRARHAVLADTGDRPLRLLGENAHIARLGHDAEASRAQALADVDALDRRSRDIADRLETATAEHVRLSERHRELGRRLAAADDANLLHVGEALQRLLALVGRARDAGGVHAQAEAERERAAEAIAAALGEADASLERMQLAETERTLAAELARDLRALDDLATASLGRQAEQLRAKLIAGEPCPVCGSTAHPADFDDSAQSELAADIRRRVSVAERRREAADAAATEAAREVEAARARSEAERRAEAAAEAARQRATATLAEVTAAVSAGSAQWAALGISVAAADIADRAAAEALGTRLAERQRQVATALTAITTLRQEADRARALADSQAEIVRVETSAAAEVARERAAKQADAERHEALSRVYAKQRAGIADELSPFLAAADAEADDVTRDARSLAQRLTTLAAEYRTLRARGEKLAADRGELVARMLGAAERAAVTAKSAERAQRELELRRNTAQALATRRAGLLGGEATEAHRARFTRLANGLAAAGTAAQRAEIESRAALTVARHGRDAAAAVLREAEDQLAARQRDLTDAVAGTGLEPATIDGLLAVPAAEVDELASRLADLDRELDFATRDQAVRHRELERLVDAAPAAATADPAKLGAEIARQAAEAGALHQRLGEVTARLAADDAARAEKSSQNATVEAERQRLAVWQDVDAAIGQSDGSRFRRFAQGVTLGQLVRFANARLEAIGPRYALIRPEGSDLGLNVVDRDMGDEVRAPRSLSGGERFLVSLALALALSGLEGRQSFVDTLFIDEGFGSLDGDTLETAIAALETLNGQGRKVGVITHVASMIERIPVQVRVEKRGSGRSIVRTTAPGDDEAGGLAPRDRQG